MIFIKFIFPQNYNFKPKLLGIIDYQTAFFCIFWCIFIFFIFNLLFNSIKLIVCLSIIMIFPILIFCFVGFNGENINSSIKYIIIYLIKPKIYVFNKKSNFKFLNNNTENTD